MAGSEADEHHETASGSPDSETPGQATPAPKPRRRTGIWAGLLALTVSAAVVLGVALHDPLLTSAGLREPTPLPPAASTLFPEPSTPAPTAGASTLPQPGAASAASPLVPARLATQINAVEKKFGGTSAAMVVDTATGKVLFQNNQSARLVPASNMKTLTVLGALSAMSPTTRFATTVTSPSPGRIVLKGGGDPYLRTVADPTHPGTATLAQLAESTAAVLRQQGRTSVTLGVDQSLFTGPDWAPTWPAGYVDQVTRISALMTDGGRTLDKSGKPTTAPRTQTPAVHAGQAFAAQLKARGITVTGAPTPAKATGAQLARVQSAPLEQLARWAMVASDNTATEMILRQLGLARQQPGSFAGGLGALRAELTALKVWRPGAVLHDGSGLSRQTMITPEMLAAAWRTIATTPALRELLTATPVAGVSGTLRDRFLVEEAAGGRGRVHAKTGTLSEISSLSGWTTTESGQSVIIVLMVNQSKNDWWARVWIDSVASVISKCGCR